MSAATIPRGFIRLHCAGSGREWIVRVDSIAAYGPVWREGEFDETGLAGAVPVQLRGQPKGESTWVTESMKDIARMCMAEGDQAGTWCDTERRIDHIADHLRALMIAAGSYSPEHEPL
jgi:hypothetical protein